MPEDLSIGAAFAFLAVIGAIRGAATWGVGIGARRAGEGNERAEKLLARPEVERAQHLVERWGVVAVTGSYVLYGTQTAVCAAAGVLRMPALKALPAIVVGSLLRAGLLVTVGFAVISAWLSGDTGQWVVALAVAAVVVAVVVHTVRRRRSRAAEARD